jgi:hypothetical protein
VAGYLTGKLVGKGPDGKIRVHGYKRNGNGAEIIFHNKILLGKGFVNIVLSYFIASVKRNIVDIA